MTEPQVPKEAAKKREEIKSQGTPKADEPKKEQKLKPAGDQKSKKKQGKKPKGKN